jgi:hypothetical protein
MLCYLVLIITLAVLLSFSGLTNISIQNLSELFYQNLSVKLYEV